MKRTISTGAGFTGRRVCVLRPSRIARTISPRKSIGLSIIIGALMIVCVPFVLAPPLRACFFLAMEFHSQTKPFLDQLPRPPQTQTLLGARSPCRSIASGFVAQPRIRRRAERYPLQSHD